MEQTEPLILKLQNREYLLTTSEGNLCLPENPVYPKIGGQNMLTEFDRSEEGNLIKNIFDASNFDLISRLKQNAPVNMLILGLGNGFDIYATLEYLHQLKLSHPDLSLEKVQFTTVDGEASVSSLDPRVINLYQELFGGFENLTHYKGTVGQFLNFPQNNEISYDFTVLSTGPWHRLNLNGVQSLRRKISPQGFLLLGQDDNTDSGSYLSSFELCFFIDQKKKFWPYYGGILTKPEKDELIVPGIERLLALNGTGIENVTTQLNQIKSDYQKHNQEENAPTVNAIDEFLAMRPNNYRSEKLEVAKMFGVFALPNSKMRLSAPSFHNNDLVGEALLQSFGHDNTPTAQTATLERIKQLTNRLQALNTYLRIKYNMDYLPIHDFWRKISDDINQLSLTELQAKYQPLGVVFEEI